LIPEVLSVCAVQYKCVTDAQRRKAALPGRGLEYVDSQGVKHPAVQKYTFVAADGVEMMLEVGGLGWMVWKVWVWGSTISGGCLTGMLGLQGRAS